MTDTPALTVLTEEEKMFRDMVRDFAEETIRPRILEMDREARIDPELLPKLAELGLMGIEVPEEHGGPGCTFFLSCLAVEEISRVDPSVAALVDVQNTLVVNVIKRWANPAMQARIYPRLAAGTVGAFCLSEAGSGSDAFALTCRAEKTEGGYVLNGPKLWITNANEADIFLVFANLDPEKGYRGITCFVVERGMPGFEVGKKEDKLGIRASSTCELLLENVEVPAENLLGEEGKGYKIAIETLNEGRIGIGAQMVGLSQGALEHATRHVQEREQFGKPLAANQGIQFQLARMDMDIALARLSVYNGARLRDAGLPFVKEACYAKLFGSEAAERVTSMAVELLGGYGFTKEYPVEKLYRDAKVGKIYEGTSNMQLQTIAKMLLAEYKI